MPDRLSALLKENFGYDAFRPLQREIMEAAFAHQRAVEKRQKLVVGVNSFQVDEDSPTDLLYISDDLADRQVADLEQVKARRDRGSVARTLDGLRKGAAGTENTMPLLLECVKAYCTVGEISDALREVYGSYEEPAVF